MNALATQTVRQPTLGEKAIESGAAFPLAVTKYNPDLKRWVFLPPLYEAMFNEYRVIGKQTARLLTSNIEDFDTFEYTAPNHSLQKGDPAQVLVESKALWNAAAVVRRWGGSEGGHDWGVRLVDDLTPFGRDAPDAFDILYYPGENGFARLCQPPSPDENTPGGYGLSCEQGLSDCATCRLHWLRATTEDYAAFVQEEYTKPKAALLMAARAVVMDGLAAFIAQCASRWQGFISDRETAKAGGLGRQQVVDSDHYFRKQAHILEESVIAARETHQLAAAQSDRQIAALGQTVGAALKEALGDARPPVDDTERAKLKAEIMAEIRAEMRGNGGGRK